jgi:hypothetical protein
LRCTFVAAAYHPSMPHSGGFARLPSGAFYEAILLAIFCEIIILKFTIFSEIIENLNQYPGFFAAFKILKFFDFHEDHRAIKKTEVRMAEQTKQTR